jgi:hypothetical protein
MSGRLALVLWVVLAVLAGLVALDRRSAEPVGAAAVRLAPGGASSITGIAAEGRGLSVHVIQAQPGGRWMIEWTEGQSQGQSQGQWPADQRLVASALRLLGSAQVETGVREVGAIEPGHRVTIRTDTGTRMLSIGAEALSGTRPTEIDGQPGSLSDGVAGLLEPRSLLAWRDLAVFPGLDTSVATVLLEHEGAVIELRRVGERWGLTRPVSTSADPGAVASLLSGLSGLRFASLGPAQDVSGAARIVLGVEGAADAPSRGWVGTISGTGMTSELRSAQDGGGRVAGVLDGAGVDPSRFDAALFVSRVSVPVPATDIAVIELTAGGVAERLERSGQTWSARSELAAALLGVLTAEPALGVSIEPVRSDEQTPADGVRVRLERFGGLPGGEVTLQRAGDSILVIDARVVRRYAAATGSAQVIASWLDERPAAAVTGGL